MNDLKNAVGKKLKEVREMLDTDIRVMGVGPIGFMGTADYNPVRVNVELGEEGFTFTKKTMKIAYHDYEFDVCDQTDFEEGIVKRAWLG